MHSVASPVFLYLMICSAALWNARDVSHLLDQCRVVLSAVAGQLLRALMSNTFGICTDAFLGSDGPDTTC